MDPNKRFEENIYLVKFIFQKHFKNCSKYYEDLMQEGYIALWESCLRFDEKYGCKFSTYACRYIQGYMLNYLKKEKNIIDKITPIDTVIFEDGDGGKIFLLDTLKVEIDDSDLENVVTICMKRMSRQKQEIVKSLLNGNTQNEAAKKTGASQSTVSRCFCKFKRLIQEEIKIRNSR